MAPGCRILEAKKKREPNSIKRKRLGALNGSIQKRVLEILGDHERKDEIFFSPTVQTASIGECSAFESSLGSNIPKQLSKVLEVTGFQGKCYLVFCNK